MSMKSKFWCYILAIAWNNYNNMLLYNDYNIIIMIQLILTNK